MTTRFPRDAERRFANCPGRERLAIAGLDFLDVRGTLAWIEARLAADEPLDIPCVVRLLAGTIQECQRADLVVLDPTRLDERVDTWHRSPACRTSSAS